MSYSDSQSNKKTNYASPYVEKVQFSKEDLIHTSGGGQTPWDPVRLSKKGVDFGNDSGIQGGAE